MALSSVSVDLINKAMPVNNEYSIGNRLQYLTTAGALSSATIVGPTITSGTISSADLSNVWIRNQQVSTWASTIQSTAGTDSTSIVIYQGGMYIFRATNGKAIRVSTACAIGTHLYIENASTGATGVVCFSTDGTVGAYAPASTFGSTGGASGCFATIPAGRTVEVIFSSAGRWLTVGGSGMWATFSTTQTASA